MKLLRRRFLELVASAIALPTTFSLAWAETYPSRPITMMVGFPPGGPTDTLARILGDAMGHSLGQTIVVETVSGASGTIATGRVVHANPDGYTIGIGNWTSHVGSAAIYPLDYDVFKDLQPIALLAASPLWILGKNALPPQTAPELIAWLKTRSQPTAFGTVGAGSAADLAGLSFAREIGARFEYVPYRGGAPVMQDLIGGQIDLTCLEASSTLANVQAGKFKAYAVMSENRWSKSPNTPTMIESGVPGLSLPLSGMAVDYCRDAQDGRRRLVDSVQTALADPSVRQRLDGLGMEIFPRGRHNREALATYHESEAAKRWPESTWRGIKASN